MNFKENFKGNGRNVFRYAPTQALNFSLKDCFQRMMKNQSNVQLFGGWNQVIGNIASGSCAGAITLAAVYHLDYSRTLLLRDTALSGGSIERKYSGLVDVYKKTIEKECIFGLYRYFGLSCAGVIVYRGLYFGLYDSAKPNLSHYF